jgi:hypothetical protein
MCVMPLVFLVCTRCRDAFRISGYVEYADSAREILAIARSQGWVRRKVENGSMWDLCPRCQARDD